MSAYVLSIEVQANDIKTDEAQFRAQVEPSLAHLTALQGSFEKSPCKTTYYPPGTQISDDGALSEVWFVKAVVLISVGKERGEHLIELYHSIATLIDLQLWEFEVDVMIDKLSFS